MRRWMMISGVLALLVGCHKGDADADVSIDQPTLVKSNPTANAPVVHFPRDCRTEDITLNKFIEDALGTCASGDYDAFRQLFGSTFTPPKKADFDRIWFGVKSVGIVSVHADREEPPNYYVHAVVELRQPDSRQRSRRDAIVAVFREEGQWRLSPPSKEIIHKILVVDSQPAEEEDGQPGGSTSRPAGRTRHRIGSEATSTRPATQPGV